MMTRIKLVGNALASLVNAERAQGMLSGIMQRGEPPRRGTKELMAAYRQMPWLRGATSKVARSVASVQWKLYAVRNSRTGRAVRYPKAQRGDVLARRRHLKMLAEGKAEKELELEEITDHPLLDMLDAGNMMMTGVTAKQVTQTHLDLKGEAYWLKERDGLGVPMAYWPLPPHWVQTTPTPADPYFYIAQGAFQEKIPITEIVWFVDPDPENPYGRGVGAAESLSDELETDEYAAKHTKAWFYNSARPDLLITGKDLTKDQAQRLEQQWLAKHQSFWKRFRPHFTNADVQVHELSQSFESMQLVELRRFERDTVIQVYGVPPEIMGIVQDSNRATIEAAKYIYTEHVIVPRLELLRDQLQERLVPDFDERLILDYESPVPEDREYNLAVAKAAPWSLLVDEWREMGGKAPLPDNKGKVFPVPYTITFAEELDGADPFGLTPDTDPDPDDKAQATPRRKVLSKGDIDSVLQVVDMETLRSAILPLYRQLIAEWGQDTLDELDLDMTFDSSLPRVGEFVRRRDVLIKGMNDVTIRRLRQHLAEGVDEGESVAQLIKRVSQVFGEAKGPRAEAIARTETMASANWAQMEGFRQSGVVEKKEWLSTRDGRTRDAHAAMDGQVRVLEKPFDAPTGEQAQQPGGFGVAELDIQCRCTVVAVLVRDDGKSHLDTEEKRAAHWKRFDARLRRDERKFGSAVKRAFQKQQNAVNAELRRLGEEN